MMHLVNGGMSRLTPAPSTHQPQIITLNPSVQMPRRTSQRPRRVMGWQRCVTPPCHPQIFWSLSQDIFANLKIGLF